MSLDRLRGLDLDLLVVLAALLETRHVSRAAERLGVTQSAVSRSLGRLRELFDDELLVRTGHGMRATARAEALRAPLGRWLANTEELVRPAEAFDPKVHPRRFRLSTADYGTEVVLRPFLQRIDREGLAVELELVPLTPEDLRALGRGEVDVVLGPRDDAGPGIVWSE
ncbi:MAG: LysR family transcriptional regulator, partial [Myxococcales bacterium]|nr:LysR family transcriptional regulator [Myxococcales bacterium]